MKKFISRIKISLPFRDLQHQGFFLLLQVLVIVLAIEKEKYYLIIINIITLFTLFKKNKTSFIFLLIMLVIVSINLTIRLINASKKIASINEIVQVVKVTTYDDYQKVVVKSKTGKYYFNSTSLDNLLYSGDYLLISGEIVEVSKEHLPNGFNYQSYLKYNGIYGKISNPKYEFIKHGFSLNIIHEKIVEYINNHFAPPASSIIAALVIGEKSLMPDDLNDQIKIIGISHLFVISGLHMQIVSSAIFLLLKKVKIKEEIKTLIVIVVLIIYFIITSFMVSILRVIIGFIISRLLQNVFRGFTPIDKLSFNAVIVLLINPYYLFSYSFLLSYTIVFGILAVSKYTKKGHGIKVFLYNNLLISLTSVLISLPIVSCISPKINLLSIIYNLFFIPFVSYILLPFSFVTLLIPPIKVVYSYVVTAFTFLTSNLSKIDVLSLSFSKISLVPIILYFLLFILLISKLNQKTKLISFLLFSLFLITWLNISFLSPKDEIYFLDLSIGDAVLIKENHNKSNILIDTGDVDDESLSNFILSKGIKQLDAVFITHSDSDHIGGISKVLSNFKVNAIYISVYDTESYNYLTNIDPSVKINKLYPSDIVQINNNSFEVLWPTEYDSDVNNNSLVLYATIFNKTFLFLGDIEKEAEEKLINKYQEIEVDYLKIAHHGSNTSTSINLLNGLKNVKLAIAMNGYSNTFGFPSSVIIKRLEEYNIPLLNTLDYGTIYFSKYYFNKEFNIYCSYGFT